MIKKTEHTQETSQTNGQPQNVGLETEIENLLSTTTGWFDNDKLYATKMRTFGQRILLGNQGGDGSYIDELRSGLRAVIPSVGLNGADVIVLQENTVRTYTVRDIFSRNPVIKQTSYEPYTKKGRHPEPLWIQPDRVVGKVHLIDATRTSEHGLLQQADNPMQQTADRLLPYMTPEQVRRLQLPAIALHHVTADLGRRGIAAA